MAIRQIEIVDNQDNWMTIHIDGNLYYRGHMSSFGNRELQYLLIAVCPNSAVMHTQLDNEEDLEEYPDFY